jgi:hypothetical protein
MRVVFDTNIFVSKVLVPQGLPAQLFSAWRDGRFEVVISPALLEELEHTLRYERIRRKYLVSDEIVAALTTLLRKDAIMVAGSAQVSNTIPDDPEDEHMLACALDGQADLIVSGDRHLLDLGNFGGIRIVSAREFLARLQAA